MTPKDKAKELVDKMINVGLLGNYEARLCALIAIDEILNIDNIKPYILHKEIIKYYINVKQEIEKL
jgi:hypothetical protein